jgi:hypothetical protein
MLNLIAQALPEFAAALTEGRDPTSLHGLHDRLGDALTRLEALAAQARHERIGFLPTEHPDPGPLLRTLLRMRHDLVILGRAAGAPLPDAFQSRFGPGLKHLAAITADALRAIANAIVGRRGPPPLDKVEHSLQAFTETFEDARKARLTIGLPVETVERIFALSFALDEFQQHLRDLARYTQEAARRR